MKLIIFHDYDIYLFQQLKTALQILAHFIGSSGNDIKRREFKPIKWNSKNSTDLDENFLCVYYNLKWYSINTVPSL